MAVPLLDLRAQHSRIRESVVAAMMKVVDDQAFILGAPVSALEADVSALSRTKYAVGCASGTDALMLVLMAQGIEVRRARGEVTSAKVLPFLGGEARDQQRVGAPGDPAAVRVESHAVSIVATMDTVAVERKRDEVLMHHGQV